jgi:hypothetical protein
MRRINEGRIIRNAIRCRACEDIVESKDFTLAFCTCHAVAASGGTMFLERCGEPGSWDELAETEDA